MRVVVTGGSGLLGTWVIKDFSPWGHRARAHAIGYIQGLMNMAEFVK